MATEEMVKINEDLEGILESCVEAWENVRDNYGDAFLELGAKGQFSDIWRKVKKLQRAVWEDEELTGEQAEQIAAEIIPHCLMLIYCLHAEI